MTMALLEYLLSVQVTERLGWTLIHFIWQGAAVALLLAVVLRVLHRNSAGARYIVSCLALGLVVVLPLITMPFLEVSGSAAKADRAPTALPATETLPGEAIEMANLPIEALDATPVKIAPPVCAPWTQRAAIAIELALPYLVLGWLLGVFGLSAWHLGGWAQLQRVRCRMVQDVAGSLERTLSELASALGIDRVVKVLQSALVEVPTVIGWIKPVILLPTSALSGLSAEQLEAILAHELAHVRRYDYFVNTIQTAVEILGFYHPGLWWISGKIRDERENCCDDLAVQITGDSIRYARALTCLEEMRHHGADLAIAASGGHLVSRIARLLGRPAPKRSRFTWLPGLIALLTAVLIVVPTALVLAVPEPSPVDAAVSELPARKGPEIDDPPRTQLMISFIVADVFSDHVLNRKTAEQARDLLTRIPTRNTSGVTGLPPSMEELQQPLSRVLSEFTAAPGKSENLIGLLESQGHAEVVCKPRILQFEDDCGSITYGDMQDGKASAMNLNVTPHVGNPDTVRLEIDFDRKYPTIDQDGSPAVAAVTMQSTLTTLGGQDVLLTTRDERWDEDGNKRLCVLLVRPEITFRADEANRPEHTDAATRRTMRESSEAVGTSENESAILIDFILAEVNTDAPLDRETTRLLINALSEEAPGVKDGIDLKQELTLGTVLRSWSTGKPLTPKAVEKVVPLLESRGFLEIQARPKVMTKDNIQAQIQISTEVWIQSKGDPAPPLRCLELGTSVRATPHLSPTSNLVILEMEVTWAKLAKLQESDASPVVNTKQIATRLAVDNDRYLSLLMGASMVEGPQKDDSTKDLLVLVRPRLAPHGDRNPEGQEEAAEFDAQLAETHVKSEPIRAQFQGTDLRHALEHIGAMAKANITIDPNVTGKVYAKLEDTTVETALEILLAGSPYIAEKTRVGYFVTNREPAAPRPTEQQANAVMIEARFLLLATELAEALQQGLPIEGVTSIEDVNGLLTLGQRIKPEKWVVLDETARSLLMKVAQSHQDSRSLAAPRITVLADESASISLGDEVPYIAGYDEPNEASSRPLARQATVHRGLALEIKPSLLSRQQIAIDGLVTSTNLTGFEDRTYRGGYSYQVPLLSFCEVAIEDIRIADGQTALFLKPTVDLPWLSEDATVAKEARPLLILIKAVKIHVDDPGKSHGPAIPAGSRPDKTKMGGFGGSLPEVPMREQN